MIAGGAAAIAALPPAAIAALVTAVLAGSYGIYKYMEDDTPAEQVAGLTDKQRLLEAAVEGAKQMSKLDGETLKEKEQLEIALEMLETNKQQLATA